MAVIRGTTIGNLTIADLNSQKDTLKILSERKYIKCLKLDLEATDPFMEYDYDPSLLKIFSWEDLEERLYDDINEITDSFV